MLSYQHTYHAGGPADVHKHSALCILLEHFVIKAKPFSILDIYAGKGRYKLTGEHAQKTKEYECGIGRLWPLQNRPPALQRYFDAVHYLNQNDTLVAYPGSPEIARTFMREQDQLILNELHTPTYRALRTWREADNRISIHKRDGLEALLGLVPPRIRRGVVFIDPSYEVKTEYTELPKRIAKAVKKWPQGTYILWYPMLSENRHDALIETSVHTVDAKIFKSEIILPNQAPHYAIKERRLLGTGLLIFNPPWKFNIQMIDVGRWVSKMLTGHNDRHKTSWLSTKG